MHSAQIDMLMRFAIKSHRKFCLKEYLKIHVSDKPSIHVLTVTANRKSIIQWDQWNVPAPKGIIMNSTKIPLAGMRRVPVKAEIAFTASMIRKDFIQLVLRKNLAAIDSTSRLTDMTGILRYDWII